MITIASAMQQEKSIELLEADNEMALTFTYSKKQGIKLFFDVTGDPQDAVGEAKKRIKDQPWGAVLYFQTAVVE